MKRIIYTVLMMFSFAGIFAQEVEFAADRPGASTGPSTVAKGVIQLEQGVQYDGDGEKGSFTFSNTMFRYGLFDGVGCACVAMASYTIMAASGNLHFRV